MRMVTSTQEKGTIMFLKGMLMALCISIEGVMTGIRLVMSKDFHTSPVVGSDE